MASSCRTAPETRGHRRICSSGHPEPGQERQAALRHLPRPPDAGPGTRRQDREMHQGHHGANHPVKDFTTGKVEIVSMNHGFAVDSKSLPESVEETHVSLFDGTNCGLRLKGKPVFSVQHHPKPRPARRTATTSSAGSSTWYGKTRASRHSPNAESDQESEMKRPGFKPGPSAFRAEPSGKKRRLSMAAALASPRQKPYQMPMPPTSSGNAMSQARKKPIGQ